MDTIGSNLSRTLFVLTCISTTTLCPGPVQPEEQDAVFVETLVDRLLFIVVYLVEAMIKCLR